jgi:hypothetical protein
MRQEKAGGARARRRERSAAAARGLAGGANPPAGRKSQSAVSRTRAGNSQKKAGAATVATCACQLPSGSVAWSSRGIAWDRAFRTTLVVAGLKAEPVSLLDGGPSGARALSSATLIAIHRVATKSRRLFMGNPAVLMAACVL